VIYFRRPTKPTKIVTDVFVGYCSRRKYYRIFVGFLGRRKYTYFHRQPTKKSLFSSSLFCRSIFIGWPIFSSANGLFSSDENVLFCCSAVNNGTSKPIAKFSTGTKDMVVAPNSMLQTEAYVHVDDIPQIAPYFDELYNSSSANIFSNAMLMLNGTLDVRLYSGAQEVQCPDGLLLLAAHHGRRWQRLRAGHG
jgi:hypothetical protein